MIKNEERKTTVGQRILIGGIALFMLAATFMLYATMVLNFNDQTAKNADMEAKEQRLQEVYSEYMTQTQAQASELSNKHFDEFVSYKSRVVEYNGADAQSELLSVDLKEGDGAEVTDANFVDYAAYYVGWLQDGTIFDSSFNSNDDPTSLKSPLEGSTNMIQGWLEGIVGMKIGGVRELTIPSTLAYGEKEQNGIPANSPLKFIIMLIDPVEPVEASDELTKLYREVYGNENL